MTPNYFKTIQSSRTSKDKLNLSKINLVVFDEADELFTQVGNEAGINFIKDAFKS
jgi:superfamily II DNA/RNA helicase